MGREPLSVVVITYNNAGTLDACLREVAWADEIVSKAGAAPLGLTPKRRTAFTIDAPAGVAISDWPLVNDVGAEFYFKPDAGQLLVVQHDVGRHRRALRRGGAPFPKSLYVLLCRIRALGGLRE